MELSRKRVMVIGLGVSGLASARFLAARGASLVMVDRREDFTALNLPPGAIYRGRDNPAWLDGVDLVVASPGVPGSSPLLQAARDRSIPVVGELELGSRFLKAPIVAVTGTNGKSTVTTLLGEIFKAAGRRTFVGGNLGTPLVEAVAQELDAIVVEVSSYQLETIDEFKPRAAIHLNLSNDHLDRYGDFDEYGAAKARIFENQTSDDWAILNRDDPQVWKLAPQVRACVISFGLRQSECIPAVWCECGRVGFDLGAQAGSIILDRFRLPGAHNRINAAAAIAGALAMGVAPEVIEGALREFCGLPHRLEAVRERLGVHYVDDSKGTNVGAVVEALAATPAPVVLIAGGVDKGGSYEPLRQQLRDKVALLILIGAARNTMSAALAGTTAIECVESIADAVALAATRARPGSTVLLSPACASFDQFKDYADRGRVFQKLVRAL